MPLNDSMLWQSMFVPTRSSASNFQLEFLWTRSNCTKLDKLMARMWKENVKHGVGHPNGLFCTFLMLRNIRSMGVTFVRDFFTPYMYEKPDGHVHWTTIQEQTTSRMVNSWHQYTKAIWYQALVCVRPRHSWFRIWRRYYICEICQEIQAWPQQRSRQWTVELFTQLSLFCL